MALDFPNSPSVGQQYNLNGRRWAWNGTGWQVIGIGLTFFDVVTDGGVDNTGATSVKVSMASAIATASMLGKNISIPSGTYDCKDANFVIPDDMFVLAATNALLERTLDPGTPGPLFALGNRVKWQGGRIKSTLGSAVVSGDNVAIRSQGKVGVSISELRVEGPFYVGITFETATDCNAYNCRVYGVANRAFYAYQQCDNISFSQCTADGYALGTTSQYTNYGFNINPANTGGSKTCTNIRVENCHVRNCTSQGIELGDSTFQATVIGNTVQSIGAIGILLQLANSKNPQYNTITGNAVNSCASHGIYVTDGYYTTIEGNNVTNCGGDGIALFGSIGCPVTGNVCNGNTVNGIGIGSSGSGPSSRNPVVGNVCVGNAGYGIKIDASQSYNVVAANNIGANTAGQLSDGGTGTVTTGANCTT